MKFRLIESLFEAFEEDTIPLEYDDIYISMAYGSRNPDKEQSFDGTIDWTYEANKQQVYEEIAQFLTDDEDIVANYPDNELYAYIENNEDELLTKYNNRLLQAFRKDAIGDAQENFNPEEY